MRKLNYWHIKSAKFKPDYLIQLSQHMTTFLQAGLSLMQALTSLEHNLNNPRLARLITSLRTELESGIALEALTIKYPQLFSHFACQLLHIGATTGQLSMTFSHLATHYREIQQQKMSWYRALTYPMFMLSLSAIILLGIITCVIPQFIQFFAQFGAPLPFATQMVVTISQYIQHYGGVCTCISGGLAYSIYSFYRFYPNFKLYCDRMCLRIYWYQAHILSMFSRHLALGLKAGLPLLDSLNLIKTLSRNSYYQTQLTYLCNEIAHGRSLSELIRACTLFTPLAVQFITSAEETGQFETMLTQLAYYYQDKTSQQMAALNRLVEPLMIVILGGCIGGIIIALYLPIVQLGSLL